MRYSFHALIDGKRTSVGHFELNLFPGCNQLVVSNHSCIYPEYRGRGLGQQLSEEKLETAKWQGFDYMIATVVSTNIPQLKIMERNGWTRLDSFFNRESGNEVIIFGRRLS